MSGALQRERLRRRLLRTRRAADRRGVLLLVVLSMLVLFLLVGTTFLITSGQYRTQSKVVEKANRSTFQPADLLERALMQLVRDTNNPSSVVRYHSLLRDLYGVDGFVGRVLVDATITKEGSTGVLRTPAGEDFLIAPRYAGIDPTETPSTQNNQLRGPTEGQVIEFFVADIEERSSGPTTRLSETNAVGLDFDAGGMPIEHQLSEIDGYYNGCLLTFMSGPCRGYSVRVLDYEHIYTKYREQNNQASDGNQIDDTVTVAARFRIVVPRRSDNRQLSFRSHPNTPSQTSIAELIASDTLGHAFIINGRPFNGAGVGFNPLALSHDLTNGIPTPRLSALEFVEMSPGSSSGYGIERALIPNPVQYFEPANVALNPSAGIDPWSKPGTAGGVYLGNEFIPLTRGFIGAGDGAYDPVTSPLYKGFAGPGDTDESYDAPDNQNMALASQALEPRLRGRVVNAAGASIDPDVYYHAGSGAPAPAYLDLEGVTIPSLHRPALANFWFHRLWNSEWLRTLISDDNERARAILEPYNANGAAQHGLTEADAAAITGIKRKFLLRPLREDHPDFDGSNPLSKYATNAIRDALENGNLVNTNGEITFPSWETVGPWDVDNDGDGVPDSVWVDVGLPVQQTEDGRWYKPLVAMLVEDLDGRLNLNAHGGEEHLAANFLDASTRGGITLQQNLAQDYASGASLISSDQLSEGTGWGVAETSLRPVLSPTLLLDEELNLSNSGAGGFLGDAQYDDYARLLQGRPDPTLGTPARTVTAALGGSVEFGRYGSGFVRGLTDATGRDVELTQPGRTLVSLPKPVSGTRDQRTPLEMLGYPVFEGLLFNRPSDYTSAPDLRGRYGLGLSAAGAPVGEPISAANLLAVNARTAGLIAPDDTMTWRGDPNNGVDDSPYELDLSVAARRLSPVSAEAVRLSYDPDLNGVVDTVSAPLVDDAPFSPAELERLLRAFDADAGKLPDRLWEIVDGFNPEKLAASYDISNQIGAGATGPVNSSVVNPSSLDRVVAAAKAAINRRVVTTEGFDLPTPNENWADRLLLGADGLPGVPRDNFTVGYAADDDNDGLTNEGDEAVIGYNATTLGHTFVGSSTPIDYDDLFLAGCDDYVVVMREDPPATPRITDYLRYRVVLELKRIDPIRFPSGMTATDPDLQAEVNRILFGNNRIPAEDPDRLTVRHSFGGLLAPELLAGVRMDLNRPLGDGRDNNGNGVVDEPAEAGEPYLFNSGFPGGELVVTDWLDLNKSGAFDQDLDGDNVLYVDTDADGLPDRFDPDDLADFDSDSVSEPVVDHLWIDDDGDGRRDANEFRPFDYTRGADANGRGGVVASGNLGVRDDARLARQLYARHLYCLMLLLTDENYLAPYDSSDLQVRQYLDPDIPDGVAKRIADALTNNPPAGYPLPHQTGDPRIDAREIAMRKLTRRRIAQWAINVVDFRDPDAIQTPFEYDENPWDGWNVIDTLGAAVLPIDGDLSTDESLGQFRQITGAGFSTPSAPSAGLSPLDDTRGVVWGAERPEVLLTEGLAWHDRKLQDTEISLGAGSQDPPEDQYDGGTVVGAAPSGQDDDLDQIRVPRGYTFLEALNPWLNDEQRPAELYSFVDPDTGQITLQEGVRFDRLANSPYIDPATGDVVRSPVWRIICVEENPFLRNATQQSNTSTGTLGGSQTLPLTDDPALAGTPFADKGVWDYDDFGLTRLDATNKYLDLIADKTQESEAATLLTEIEDVLGVQPNGTLRVDADGLLVSTGVRETPPLTPDPSWPAFDRLLQPQHILDGGKNTFPVDISSTIDANNTGTVDRYRFRKPIRFIERAAYMVTSLPALGGLPSSRPGSSSPITGKSIEQPTPRVEFISDPKNLMGRRYDPSGYRLPPLEIQVPNFSSSREDQWWQFGIGEGSGFARISANRFASFDWFDQFDDPTVPDTDRLERLGSIRLAPLLPGRRAVIGTQGALYEDAGERGYFSTTNPRLPGGSDDPSDPSKPNLNPPNDADSKLGPKFLRGRYTTIVSGDGNWEATRGDLRSPAAGYWRFEMIPSGNPNVHQFAVRMNGRTESITAYSGDGDGIIEDADITSNVTVDAASQLSSTTPVIAIPIDHFSISEPLDKYLLRLTELDSASTPSVTFQKNWSIGDIDEPDDPADVFLEQGERGGQTSDAVAEGYFARGDQGVDPGFDEPFDIEPALIENQTTPNYRSVHLERLANPLLPWNPPPYIPGEFTSVGGSPATRNAPDFHDPRLPVNPYLPVDSMPLDLTSLNSLGSEDQVAPKDNKYVNRSASEYQSNNAGTGGQGGPETLHRKSRFLPTQTATLETPIAFDSNVRGRPWGNFRMLWTTTVGRLLWRQARPTTTAELVRGAKDARGSLNLGNEQIYTATQDTLRPTADGGQGEGKIDPNNPIDPNETIAPENGYDFRFDAADIGVDPKELILNFGWRMTLGFPEARMGRHYLGQGLRWRDVRSGLENAGVAAMTIDLDGDGSGFDLLSKAEVIDDLAGLLFLDSDANGRPDSIETRTGPNSWDANGDGVVDRHEEAWNPLNDRATTPELAWPNRPFVSAGELLQVPAWGGSRMLTYFSAYNWLHTQAPEFLGQTQVNPYNGEAAVFHDGHDYSPRDLTPSNRGVTALDADFANDRRDELNYDGAPGSDGFDDGTRIRMAQHPDVDDFLEEEPSNDLRFRETLGHFGHLANFFQTARFPSQTGYIERDVDTIDGNGDVTTNRERYLVPVGAAHFYRLLDYVHVPSRFVGTDTLLNADVFGSAGVDPEDPRAPLTAPFNRVNRYREPGRVNLNTIVGRRDTREANRIDPNGNGEDDSGFDNTTDQPRLADYWSEVYDGLMHRKQDASEIDYNNANLLKMGHLGPAWRDVALSRRGYVQPSFDPTVDPGDEAIGLSSDRQNQLDYSPRRMHPAFPTLFANPFRAPGEGANVPLAHMVQTGVDATLLRAHPLSPGADGAWGRRGVDERTVKKDSNADTIANNDGIRDDAGEAGTLTLQLGGGRVANAPTQPIGDRLNADVVLARFQNADGRRGALPDTLLLDAMRPHPTDLNSREVSPRQSVADFVHNSEISKRANPVPLFSGATLEPSLDTERNATTRFSPIQRLSSLATTRSNCYAVWITVGFFEVKPAREDTRIAGRYGMTDGDNDGVFETFSSETQRDFFFRNYPEGWTLGQELDLDTGQNRRHRGFYVVDRTRPVAFRPGEDANVAETILLRRRIE